MFEQHSGARTHKVLGACAAALAIQAAATGAFAQATTASDGAPSEAARRAAMSPYRFILQHSSAPPRKPAPEAPKKVAAPEPPPAPVPAPAPVQAAARTPAPAVVAPPPPAPAPAAVPVAPAAAPAPEPAQVATRNTRPPPPPPAPARREIIPVRIDEPRLPPALLRERPSGLVKVQFEIQPDGSTGAVKVLSSTNQALNRHTVNAVSGWKFESVDEVLTVETELAFQYD